jgi:hypothetical protein
MDAPSNRQLPRRLNKEFHKMDVLRGMSAIRMTLPIVQRQRRAIVPRTNSLMVHMSGWAEVRKHLC